VFIWHDKNDDGVPNFDEASTEAAYSEGFQERRLFDFRDTEETSIEGYAYMSAKDRIDFKFLSEFNQGTEAVDYSFMIGGPDAINKKAPGLVWFFLEPNNELGIAQFDWGVQDLGRQPFTFTDKSQPTVYGKNEWFVNFATSTPAMNTYGSNQFIVWAEITYNDPAKTTWYQERRVSVTENDYSAFIEGPMMIDRAMAPEFWYKVKSNIAPDAKDSGGNPITIKSVNWDIVDPYWNPIPFSDTSEKTKSTSPWEMRINFNSLEGGLEAYPEEEMWLWAEIEYSDGTWWYTDVMLMFASEATSGTAYGLDIKLKDLRLGTSTLTTGTYKVTILDYWSWTQKSGTTVKTGSLVDGGALVSYAGLTYATPDLDWIEITIDTNDDGTPEWVAYRDIFLMAPPAGEVPKIPMDFMSWDFWEW
jgi:hypothetical protein